MGVVEVVEVPQCQEVEVVPFQVEEGVEAGIPPALAKEEEEEVEEGVWHSLAAAEGVGVHPSPVMEVGVGAGAWQSQGAGVVVGVLAQRRQVGEGAGAEPQIQEGEEGVAVGAGAWGRQAEGVVEAAGVGAESHYAAAAVAGIYKRTPGPLSGTWAQLSLGRTQGRGRGRGEGEALPPRPWARREAFDPVKAL